MFPQLGTEGQEEEVTGVGQRLMDGRALSGREERPPTVGFCVFILVPA